MRREERLRRAIDFAAVYREGRALAHPLFVLRTRRNGLPHNRYGFVTGRRVGKAVVRNRVRRRMREAVRRLALKSGWDVVIVARAAAAEATFQQIANAARELGKRAGLLTLDEGSSS